MNSNSYGEFFKITTFGESHGAAVGVIIDGCPAGLEISEEDIQKELDRRKPGQSKVSTLRKEDDAVEILSGVFEGKTTGTPIALMVRNTSQRSQDYNDIKDLFRPGHADYTYFKKFGIRDYRGGGRASARETIGRVAASAVAKKILSLKGIDIFGYIIQIENVRAEKFDRDFIEQNPIRTADVDAYPLMEEAILKAKMELDSVGGVIELCIENVPAGIGEPVFDGLNARLAYAIMSIPAVKGVEFGAGFKAATMRGSENNDEITPNGFLSNNAGGTLGGISSGQDIVLRFAVTPTSSILTPKKTIDINGNPHEIVTKGRHDPCVAPRGVVVAEAMAALTIVDMMMINAGRQII